MEDGHTEIPIDQVGKSAYIISVPFGRGLGSAKVGDGGYIDIDENYTGLVEVRLKPKTQKVDA